ncbi:MAG: insulinase family protein, partial [Cytophagales bacterium]|nr:insulinase family protein [Cytophagales bacterium]
KDPAKAGIAALTANLMNEDTEKYTAEEMTNALEKLGSSISVNAGGDNLTVSVQSLTKNLDATLALLGERMLRPKFSQEDFDRLKKQQLEGIANQATQPVAIANNVYSKLLYGDSDIRSVPVLGTEATVKSITLDDVKKFYADNFSPSVTNLVVVGDLDQPQVLGKLDFLKAWPARNVAIPAPQTNKPVDQTRIYLVDKESAPQSQIRVGYLTDTPFDATGDYYKSFLMNYVLGGAFNSRINLNLREDKGWTYGAGSGFASTEIAGPFTAQAGVRGNATDSSVVEIMKEITNYRDKGITADELAFLRNSVGQSEARQYETPFQKAGFLNQIIRYGLEKDFVEKRNEILRTITTEELSSLAQKQLPADKMHILVVGDKQKVKPGLEKLGYEVVELDKEGKPVVAAAEEKPEDKPAGAAGAGSSETQPAPDTGKKKSRKSEK